MVSASVSSSRDTWLRAARAACGLGLCVLLAACGGETPQAGPSPAPGDASVSAPAGEAEPSPSPTPFKAELVLCLTQEPDALLGRTNAAGRAAAAALLPRAVSYGADYLPEPDLLAALPSVEAGTLRRGPDDTLLVTLHYREGLVWSDGTPFTAADALLGFSLPASPPEASVTIIEARQVDDRTLELTLEGDSAYPYVPPGPPLPAHVLGGIDPSALAASDYARRPAPTLGPYTLTEWVAGSHMLLSANPNYRPAPPIPVVRMRFLADPAQAASEMTSGNCDVMLDPGAGHEVLPALADAQTAGRLRASVVPGAVSEQIIFNTYPDPFSGLPLFADARVRQAAARAVDRAALAQIGVQGLTPVMDSWLPADHWAYTSPGALPPYDPAAAAALLDAAGWVDADGDGVREYQGAGGVYACQRGEWQVEAGTPLAPLLITTDDPYRVTLAEKVRADLAAVGVGVRVQALPAAALFAADGPLTRRAFDLALFSALASPDPGGISRWLGADVFLHPIDRVPVHRWQLEERWLTPAQQVEVLAYDSTPALTNNYQGQNFGGWCSEEANLLTVQAVRALTVAEKQPLYGRQQALVAGEVPVLPLFARPQVTASAIYVCGLQPGPFDPPTWNLAAWTFDESGACGPPE